MLAVVVVVEWIDLNTSRVQISTPLNTYELLLLTTNRVSKLFTLILRDKQHFSDYLLGTRCCVFGGSCPKSGEAELTS